MMHRTLWTFISQALIAGFCLLPAARGQQFDELQRLWSDQLYERALPGLVALWQQPPNRTYRVGYMIGTSECRIAGLAANGRYMLGEVLHSFPLPPAARTLVRDELTRCSQVSDIPVTFRTPDAASAPAANLQVTPGVRGKEGFEIRRTSLARSSLVLTPVSPEKLAGRLSPLLAGQDETEPDLNIPLTEAAIAALRTPAATAGAQLARGSSVVGPFAVTTTISGPVVARNVGLCLRGYEAALKTQFGMKMPGSFINVFVAREFSQVEELAAKLHGIRLPPGTLAYSVTDDLSIVGSGDSGSCGSLGHELTHLMFRTTFGNAPAWLEEGLASAVALTQPDKTGFRFRGGWRDEVLRERWSLRPDVAKLLELDWVSYTTENEDDLPRAAAIHAMASVFVRYLAEKSLLLPVYQGIRDNRFSADLSEYRTDQQIVESATGRKLDKIDQDFVAWFQGR